MTVTDFPTIDFEGFAELIAKKDFGNEKVNEVKRQLREACAEYGFFYIKNHDYDQNEINEIFSISKEYFDQPNEVKNKDFIANNHGYSKFGQEKLSEEFQDFKESYNFRNDYEITEHPEVYKKHFTKIDDFIKKGWVFARTLLTGLALCLGIEPDFFLKAHTNKEKSETIFRLLHYPPVKDNVSTKDTIRAGSHSDFGTLTILFYQTSTDEEIESSTGLQVRKHEKGPNGEEIWMDVPAKPSTIVVNIADLLSFWTEGRFISATHRVIIPKGNAAKKSRYAIGQFINPDASFKIYPAKCNLPAPCPAIEVEPGVQKATYGEVPFFYGDTGDTYFQRRTADTNY